jgi:hypothetical protein
MPSSVVFLGPSLPIEDAKEILDASYLPPIRRGDIDLLLRENPPAAVGIVDGRFLQSFSVSPKEILKAMDAGIRFFGASSMGALRATELARYGMMGVGQIFELFASGELDADDEVAMVFDQSSMLPVSVPLVNMRIAVAEALRRGVITEETRRLFIEEAQRIYFPERTFKRVLHHVEDRVPAQQLQALRDYLPYAPNAKRADAIKLLHQMKSYLSTLDA